MNIFDHTKNKRLVNLKDSVATQLLTIVFAIYFIVTLTLTVIHMVAEYSNEKNDILKDFSAYEQTFHRGLAKAIWNLDDEQITALLTGISKNPIVVGVKVVVGNSESVQAIGTYINQEGEVVENMSASDIDYDQTFFFDDLFSYQFPIMYADASKTFLVGRLTLYSSTGIILNNVKIGFIFIIVNSILKTIALWLIFLIVSQYVLNRPLEQLNNATHQLDMDNLENNKVNIQTERRNELTLLGEAFNSMTDKLRLSKDRMGSYQKIYGILSSNSIKNGSKILFREVCKNTGVDNGILYFSGDRDYSAIKYYDPSTEFFSKTFQKETANSLFGEQSTPFFVNSVQKGDPVLNYISEEQEDQIIGSHLLLLHVETSNPSIFVLIRHQRSAPFDNSDLSYVKGVVDEVYNTNLNIKTLRDKSKIEGEMETASLVQQSFIPDQAPIVPGFEISYLFRPAKSVSGDYCDFIPINDDSIGMVVADVSGKGVPAAMYANTARILLRDKAQNFTKPDQLLRAVNKSLKDEFQSNRFLTMSYMVLDHQKSRLEYANAGHEPLLLLRAETDEVELLKPSGYPFSALHSELFDSRIKAGGCKLKKGDLIFSYTDGLTDIINYRNEMYGEERLYRLISKYRDYPVTKLVEEVELSLLRFQGETDQMDDMTVIAFKKQ